MRAPCRRCGGTLYRWDDACPACGAPTGQRLPWYGWVLGAVLVLLLFLGLGDIGALGRLVGAFQHLLAP